MKKIAWLILRILHIADLVQLKMLGYLVDTGWFNSFYRNESIDKNSNPIPWCTYPFIYFIEPRLNNSMKVFEFGSGNSTFWFSNRISNIVSLEHDRQWYIKLLDKMPKNARLVYKEFTIDGEYANYINETGEKYDLILIDGRDRVNCVKRSVQALSAEGVLIFDNSNVETYVEAMEFLNEHNFKRLDFHGIAPIKPISSCTTIFYKDINCLHI